VTTREEWHWTHACKSFKRAGVGTNGIVECNFLPKNAHHTFVKEFPCCHACAIRLVLAPVAAKLWFVPTASAGKFGKMDCELPPLVGVDFPFNSRALPYACLLQSPIPAGQTPSVAIVHTLPLMLPFLFEVAWQSPSVFGRNLQGELVRKVDTREECHWSHACSLQASRRGNQWHPRV
jgi:hypothetical protein